jgi:hypothetical protein
VLFRSNGLTGMLLSRVLFIEEKNDAI